MMNSAGKLELLENWLIYQVRIKVGYTLLLKIPTLKNKEECEYVKQYCVYFIFVYQ